MLLFPPLSLLLLWRSSQIRLRRKILGTIYIPAFSILYVAAICAALYFWCGIDIVEWRGGYLPALTLSKTLPDYEKLELFRSSQLKNAPHQNHQARNAGDYWKNFRGPNGDGHYDEKPILTKWPDAGLRQIWRQPIGGGYASFSIAEGRAYTIEQRREQEVATAYDVETGRELWACAWSGKFEEIIGGEGPRATPTYDDGRLYPQGGLGELRCLDAATGKLIWRHDIVTENQSQVLTYGYSASPLIVDEKIIVLPGGPNGKSIVAYHKISGALIWKTQNDKQAYTTPVLATLAGQPQILAVSAKRVIGISTAGNFLWSFPWTVQNENAIAQPVLLNSNQLLLSAGYGTGCSAFEINQTNSIFSARLLWKNKYLKNKFTSSVFCDGYIYGLDEDILTCLDAKTGERKWKDGRFGYGQLILASGHLVILSGTGELALVKATPEKFEELARFQAIHGKTWNHPAISDGKIFVRNAVEMACFDLNK